MPMMISPYDVTINSLTGHCIAFKANEPVMAPDSEVFLDECMARGISKYAGEPENPAPAAPAPKVDNTKVDTEAQFQVGLDQALMRILVREDPNDLNAQNWPKVAKVTAEMSPDLRRPTATEVSEAYQKLQENIELAE